MWSGSDRVEELHSPIEKQSLSSMVYCIDRLLEVNSLTLVVGLVDSSLISFLLKLLQLLSDREN